ncbi:MAG: transposase [Propionibacterium acidifaciens]|uniref:transposase n=1 Tax=Propionibacterium acidifaciens TaxID=556499 RepID=UPI00361A47BE
MDAGWKVHTARRGPPRARGPDPPDAAPGKGSAPGRSVDRQRTSQSFPGALSLIGKKVKLYPIEGNQNTEQTILALDRLQRETEAGKIAVALDNARFHHAKMLAGLYEPGRLLESITSVFLPPYAPDHNPVEHVRNAARNNIATIQRETPEETFGAFVSYVTGRTVDYDFEHLPPRETRNDLVS